MNRSHQDARTLNSMTQYFLLFMVAFLVMIVIGALCRTPLLLNLFFSFLIALITIICEYWKTHKKVGKADMSWMQRIAEQWGGNLTTDSMISSLVCIDVESIDAFFSYDVRQADLTITFYTYTNPYTQIAKDVINKRLNDILMIEGVTCDNNIEHTLFGAMFFLHVSRADANDLLLGKMKTLFERIKEDERSHQTDIYFRVVGVEYDDDVCYFECSFQSEIKRAMVVCPEKILRYDVSKGDIIPESMNEVTEEDINSIADDETFELLPPQEFYRLWGNEN